LFRATTVVILLACAPSAASADWLIMPFYGTAFASQTTFLDLDRGAGQTKTTFGASVALLSDGFLGLEADVGHSPRFFQGDRRLVLSSRVTTVSGNLVVAAPLALTRESLRPYLVGGLGLLQVRADDAIRALPIEKDLLGLTVGGGAIGMITPFTGVRFDLRHLKAVSGERGSFAREGTSRLSFWRASVALTVRY
jgi:hypothetical protein